METFYNNDYAASRHAFDTTRKAQHLAAALTTTPVRGVRLSDPSGWYGATDDLIERLHSPAYVRAVRTGEPRHLAEAQGFLWDRGIYTMARAHNAGLVAAVDAVTTGTAACAGSLSSGLHHARADGGAGFCTFNGLAVAAHHAHDLGVRQILVLDFDAHGGGGTWSMTRDVTVAQIDVSVNGFDGWHPEGDPRSRVIRSTVNHYISDITAALDHASDSATWEIVLYNAGMDPANSGVSADDLALREQLVAQWAASTQTPVVFALAGGYTWGGMTMEDVVGLHRLTIEAFAQVDTSPTEGT